MQYQQTGKKRSIFLLPDDKKELIYSADAVKRIQELTSNDGLAHNAEQILKDPASYQDVELVFSGWGSPKLDQALIDSLPQLQAYFYASGSVSHITSDTLWERGILLTSAYQANALPVVDYTVAMICLSLKQVWGLSEAIRSGSYSHDRSGIPGVYWGSRVGVISLGSIGRLVCKKLLNKDLDVHAYDPFADDRVFQECGAKRASSLKWIFENCDVITLHAPWLPETEHMIESSHLRSMRRGATFINTSRGKLVDEAALLQVLRERPEIYAVLDVLQDETDYCNNPLSRLQNILITPHIAGSMGRECQRMGDMAVEECARYLRGEPPLTSILKDTPQGIV